MISVATLSIPQHRLSEAACVELLLYLFFKQVQLKKKKKGRAMVSTAQCRATPNASLEQIEKMTCQSLSPCSNVTVSSGHCLKGVSNVFAEHKVIIVGLDNAGKTTILYQL